MRTTCHPPQTVTLGLWTFIPVTEGSRKLRKHRFHSSLATPSLHPSVTPSLHHSTAPPPHQSTNPIPLPVRRPCPPPDNSCPSISDSSGVLPSMKCPATNPIKNSPWWFTTPAPTVGALTPNCARLRQFADPRPPTYENYGPPMPNTRFCLTLASPARDACSRSNLRSAPYHRRDNRILMPLPPFAFPFSNPFKLKSARLWHSVCKGV
jgi:hypothetical protein